jgi:RND family efflux transporter MFP subunit
LYKGFPKNFSIPPGGEGMIRRNMRRRRFWRALKITALILGILAMLGYGAFIAVKRLTYKPEVARFAKVDRGDIVVKLSETGRIEPALKVVVKSKVAGRIVELRVKEGDRVRAGEVIARLDPTEIRREANQIEADLEAARARADQSRVNALVRREQLIAQIEQAQADLRAAQANVAKLQAGPRQQEIASAAARAARAQAALQEARRELERQRKLAASGLGGRKTAEAEVRAAAANLEKLKAGSRAEEIARAQALLSQAQVRLEEARRNVERQRQLNEQGLSGRRRAEADLRAAQAALAKAQAGPRPQEIASAEARLKQAETRLAEARRNQRRQQELVAQGLSGRKQAEADLLAAEAALEKARAGARPQEIATAEATVSQAQARLAEAERNLKRQTQLFEKGFIARQQVDAAQTQLEVARAEWKSAQEQLDLLKAGSRVEDLRAAQAQVDRARAALETVRESEKQALAEAEASVRLAEEEARAAREELHLLQAGSRPEDIRAAEAQVALAQAALDTILENERNALADALAQLRVAEQEYASAQQDLRLLQLGSRPEDLQAAEAQVDRARVAQETAAESEQQGVAAAEAQVRLAEADYQAALEEWALLQAGNRPEDIASAAAQRQRAAVALRNAREATRQNEAARKEVAAAEAQVRRLMESLANVQTQLDDTTIIAPISGTVIRRAVEPGELITSGISGLSAGMEIVTIADLSQLVVKANVNEVDIAQLYLGQPAEIRVDAYRNESFPAIIDRISPASKEAIPGQSSEIVWFEVRALLLKPDPRLKTGMSADVDLITQRAKNALRLPREAVVEEDKRHFVYLVRDPALLEQIRAQEEAQKKVEAGEMKPREQPKPLESKDLKTEKTPVKVGLKDDNYYEIRSGVKLGDTVWIKPPATKRRGFEIREGPPEE